MGGGGGGGEGGGGGGGGGTINPARELDQTPTWAVAAVCAVIIIISICLEKVLHHIGKWFEKRKKMALVEALEKVKNELMIMGFISLLFTFGQTYVTKICIPERLADTMLFCPIRHEHITHGPKIVPLPAKPNDEHGGHRRLLYQRRFLGGGGGGYACKEGHVPLISTNGLHQLHIFIFFLAVFHVLYSAVTMMLGRLKIRAWKAWEREAWNDQEYMNDAKRFRLTHETSFVKYHTSAWTENKVSFYTVCFFRQFFRSVLKADYLTMRHGFISVHLAPGTKFNFQQYIKRSLEDDFKVVVGISPALWASAVTFLLLDVHGWNLMSIISVVPLVIILAVGTKLQKIIAEMALDIKEKHAVIQGMPLVEVSDRRFWFGWPQLVLHLIHFVLFMNAFEIIYFLWVSYEFGLRSCFHEDFNRTVTRVCLGVMVQFICSYVTLPLYALVTQMGSTMKRSIFDDQTSKALKQWHIKAKKKNDGKPEPMPTKTLGSPKTSPGHSPAHSGTVAKQAGNTSGDIEMEASTANRTPHDLLTDGINHEEINIQRPNSKEPPLAIPRCIRVLQLGSSSGDIEMEASTANTTPRDLLTRS